MIKQGRFYLKYFPSFVGRHKVHFFEGRIFCVFDQLALRSFFLDADVVRVSTLENQRDKQDQFVFPSSEKYSCFVSVREFFCGKDLKQQQQQQQQRNNSPGL